MNRLHAMTLNAADEVARLAQENSDLRRIIADLGYCAPHASLEFMRLIPAEVRATLARARGDAK